MSHKAHLTSPYLERTRVVFLIRALILSCACLLSASLQAQCTLSPAAQASLRPAPGFTDWDRLTGKAFAEADEPSCTQQAIADFTTLSTWPNASSDSIGMAIGALEYLAAVQHMQQGDTAAAITGLHHVVDTRLFSSVQDRAVNLLIRLISSNPASKEWDLLTPVLEERAQLNDGGGYALGGLELLTAHDLASGNAARGQSRICNFLSSPRPMQDRFKAEVLLLEYLVAEGDGDSAQLLTVKVDSDLGRQLLAPDWRIRYLRASAASWSASTMSDGRQRLARYQRGLLAVQREMQ